MAPRPGCRCYGWKGFLVSRHKKRREPATWALPIDPAMTCAATWLRDEIKRRFKVPVRGRPRTSVRASVAAMDAADAARTPGPGLRI